MTYRPVRCRVCDRIRVESGDWLVTDGAYPGAADGICVACMNALEASRRLGNKLKDRRARRERREGRTDYGPATGDPFAGFREE